MQEIVAQHTGSIRDCVDRLQKESTETKKQIRNIESMLERLLKHSQVNDDDDDEAQEFWELAHCVTKRHRPEGDVK